MSGTDLILGEVVPRLVRFGLRKRSGLLFTVKLTSEVDGFLGLNCATKHSSRGTVEVNPVVGVRHQGIERLLAELTSRTFHSYVPPTISSPIGYMMPDQRYRSWVFEPDSASATADDLVGAIEDFAIPFYRVYKGIETIACALSQTRSVPNSEQRAYRRPIAEMLAGNPSDAMKVLLDELARLGDRGDAAANDFRRFASAFQLRYGG